MLSEEKVEKSDYIDINIEISSQMLRKIEKILILIYLFTFCDTKKIFVL